MNNWNPKVFPPHEFPSETDYEEAVKFVIPQDWPENQVFTDEMRKNIQKTARSLMMKRKTIQ